MGKGRKPWRKVRAPSQLTKRELEIALLLAEGLSNSKIAESFGIKEITIYISVKTILDKLEVESRENVAEQLRE